MNPADYVQFLLALIFVLGLIGIVAVILRRYGPGRMITPRRKPGDPRRLRIVESLPLDPRRRLLLVQRDGVEHLLLLGPESDRVVESDIVAPQQADAAVDANTNSPAAAGAPGTVQRRFDDVVRLMGRRRDAPGQKEEQA